MTALRPGVNLGLMSWFACCALLLYLIGVISPVGAQESIVKTGASIRIRPVGDERFHAGQLERVTGDSVFLERCPDCNRLAYGRTDVANLDVYQPYNRGNRTLTGIGLGGLLGIGLGFLSAATCHGGDKCDASVVAIPFGGIAGMLIGGIVGYATAYKWHPVIPTGGH